jgi:23S rRNA G2445 N2-methylase RlmL
VTANFVGKRNYSTDEIKDALAVGISDQYGWPYAAEDKSEVNIRIFLEHEWAYVGMRLAATPLHRRPYKQSNLPGSLKPTIAAAMLYIAGVLPGESVLDPFCGAGTILIEAALLGAEAYGGDNDPQALAAARNNAVLAGVSIAVEPWDA